MNTLPNDPMILLSVINTKLRDRYADVEALCRDLDIEKADLDEKLASAGYFYDREKNRYL